jgi:hypothetical protein
LKNTSKIRGNNFIEGDPEKSFWLGKHTHYLKPILQNMKNNVSAPQMTNNDWVIFI